MSKVNLTLYETISNFGVGLTEASQHMTVRFAYVDSSYEQVTRNFRCKDYMNVMPFVMKNPEEFNGKRIYGITYNATQHPIDLETTRISIWFEDGSNIRNFIKNIAWLNMWEDKHGIKPTTFHTTQYENIIVIEGDKNWQSNCWKMSLYTQFLRSMGWPSAEAPGGYDYNYAKNIEGKEDLFLSLIHTEFDEKYSSVSTAHSSSGVQTLLHYLKTYMNGMPLPEFSREYQPILKLLRSKLVEMKVAA